MVEGHKEEYAMEDMKESNKLKSWQAQKRDMFDWLKVPSRFTLLKKMVRETLVEVIGERKHREQIEKALDDYLKTKEKDSEARIVNSKINLIQFFCDYHKTVNTKYRRQFNLII